MLVTELLLSKLNKLNRASTYQIRAMTKRQVPFRHCLIRRSSVCWRYTVLLLESGFELELEPGFESIKDFSQGIRAKDSEIKIIIIKVANMTENITSTKYVITKLGINHYFRYYNQPHKRYYFHFAIILPGGACILLETLNRFSKPTPPARAMLPWIYTEAPRYLTRRLREII